MVTSSDREDLSAALITLSVFAGVVVVINFACLVYTYCVVEKHKAKKKMPQNDGTDPERGPVGGNVEEPHPDYPPFPSWSACWSPPPPLPTPPNSPSGARDTNAETLSDAERYPYSGTAQASDGRDLLKSQHGGSKTEDLIFVVGSDDEGDNEDDANDADEEDEDEDDEWWEEEEPRNYSPPVSPRTIPAPSTHTHRPASSSGRLQGYNPGTFHPASSTLPFVGSTNPFHMATATEPEGKEQPTASHSESLLDLGSAFRPTTSSSLPIPKRKPYNDSSFGSPPLDAESFSVIPLSPTLVDIEGTPQSPPRSSSVDTVIGPGDGNISPLMDSDNGDFEEIIL